MLKADNSDYPTVYCNRWNCYSADFKIKNSKQASLTFDGYYSGQYMNISANDISSSLQVNCNGQYSCRDSRIYAQRISSGGLTVSCQTYACYSMIIYANSINSLAALNCWNYWSCYSLDIYAQNAAKGLNVNCYGNQPCYSADIWCPEDSSCNIDCASTSSCIYSRFHVENQFTKKLSLDCGDSTSCSSVDIVCNDNSATTNFGWDSTNLEWRCQDYGCCPVSSGNITCAPNTVCQVCNKYIRLFAL